MDDLKNNAVAEKEVETTTQTSSPQVEAPTTETQTPTEQATPEAELRGSQTEDERREFQARRLNEENRRLKEEREVLRRESPFSSFKQAVPNDNLAQPVRVEDYTDPYSGEVNRPAYNAAQEARLARQAAVMAQSQVADQLDEYKARQSHPELFADPEIEEEIAAKWLWNKTRGEDVTISELADRYAKRNQKAVSKAEKSGAEKALSEVSPKEQAALQATSQTSTSAKQQTSAEDAQRLAEGTRFGSDDALAARMRNVPWANK